PGLIEELDAIMTKHGIKKWSMSKVQKKYAFEVPGVSAEAEWIEVSYPFSDPALRADLQGSTFSQVFGTNTSALERLVLRANLMGPSGIEIREASRARRTISWCKTEVCAQFCSSDPGRIQSGDGFNIRPLSAADFDTGKYPAYCRTAPPLVVA